MLHWLSQSVPVLALVFVVAAAVIGLFGVRMTHVARELAAQTGLGEALVGAVFIGASTSLSGIIASTSVAWQGHAELAVSNALGGIAAQTVFLAIADLVYRRANLEHAAASVENLMMSAFLLTLLSVLLLGLSAPGYQVLGVHPASLALIAGYGFGVRILARTHQMPMWLPKRTRETRTERKPKHRSRQALRPLWIRFAAYSAAVGLAGWVLGHAGIAMAAAAGMSESVVGGVLIAVATSLPELVVAVTAVRAGALTLALGDIIGGNAFDTLFVAMSDIAYREGSIYAAVTAAEQIWLALTLLMTGVLLMGLIHRERFGIANIGFESFLIIVIYVVGLGLVGFAN